MWIQATRAAPHLAGLGRVRELEVNGQVRQIVSVKPSSGRLCRFFDGEGCAVYPARPLSCRVPLLTIRRMGDVGYIWKGAYSRHHLMHAVDGGPVRCDFNEFSREQFLENDLPVLRHLQRWAEHWSIETWVPELVTGMKAVFARGIPIRLEFRNEE